MPAGNTSALQSLDPLNPADMASPSVNDKAKVGQLTFELVTNDDGDEAWCCPACVEGKLTPVSKHKGNLHRHVHNQHPQHAFVPAARSVGTKRVRSAVSAAQRAAVPQPPLPPGQVCCAAAICAAVD